MNRRTLLTAAALSPLLFRAEVDARQSPTTWRIQHIIATRSTVPGHVGSMTAGEKSHAYTMINALPGHIKSFSNNLGNLSQHIVETTRPITRASDDGGGGVWVSPSDASALHDYFGSANYHAAFLWTSGSVLRSAYSGLTVAGRYPTGHSYIPVGDDPAMDSHQTLVVHELSWHLCAAWIANGYPCPPGLDASAYLDPRTGVSYQADGDGYYAFYTDLLQGKINDGQGHLLGGSPAAWKSQLP